MLMKLMAAAKFSAPLLQRIDSWSKSFTIWRGGASFGAEDWKKSLGDVSASLTVLAGSTEGEFLAIGEKLQDFYFRAQDISKVSSSVAVLLTGDQSIETMNVFRNVIERMESLDRASRQRIDRLMGIADLLDDLDSSLSGFHRITRVLNILCLTTRVESARLGGADIGFDELADDVKRLAHEVDSKRERLSADSLALRAHLQTTFVSIRSMEAKQQDQAKSVLNGIMSALAALREKQEQSSETASEVSRRFDAISGSIGEIVSSLQLHDITRQRLEHGRDAVDAVLKEASPESTDAPENGPSETDKLPALALAKDICELQMAQLRHAGDELSDAVERIIRSLRDISLNVAEVSEQTRRMTQSEDALDDSFLSSIEAGCSSVASMLEEYRATDGELSEAVGAVGDALAEMSSFASEIESIGTSIKLIALNAIIKACHIGESGAALGVLAEEIHELSVDTCRHTERVTSALASITSAACSLSSDSGGNAESNAERIEGVVKDLEAMKLSLRSTTQEVALLLDRMNTQGYSLSGDIEVTAVSIDAHRRFSAILGDAILSMGKIAETVGSRLPEGFERSEYLMTLAASYTMQKEREVHLLFANQGDALPEAPEAEADAEVWDSFEDLSPEREAESVKNNNEEDELGDNVELF